MNFQTTIEINGKEITTLKDILPESGELEILFIAKTPSEKSVNAGHYFQGQQGQSFWRQIKGYGILNVKGSLYEDETLLDNNFGITDIVKKPRNYSSEPSNQEYMDGVERITSLIKQYKPRVIIFVYKKVLDKIIEQKVSKDVFEVNRKDKSIYGFNSKYEEYFGCKVFAMPLPGVGSQTRSDIERHMNELKYFLGK